MEINDHGLFWWAGTQFGDGHAAGLLTIDPAGVIMLELHQTLPGRSGIEAVFRQEVSPEVGIVGCLKATGHYVLLKGLQVNGGRSGLISYENFIAEECFISSQPICSQNFIKLKFSLDGLQEWVRPGKIKCDDSLEGKLSIGLECYPVEAWKIDSGEVELRHHFIGRKPSSSSSSLDVGLVSEITYNPTSDLSSQDMIEWYRAIQDLLLILTNCTLTLKWPRLIWRSENKDIVVNYYFRRHQPAEDKISWHTTLLPFPRVREIFGSMIDKWIIARKSLGPGVALYLGTRRNFRLYAEHRFVNLVWGLEALARRNDPAESDDTGLSNKIERISQALKSVKDLNAGDRNWLKHLMKRSSERPLSERLFEELRCVAIKIPEENLRDFCKVCADLRNDLSHHGGERMPGDYETFRAGILNNIDALSRLYLLVIIRILGVSMDEIERIVFRDPGSAAFKVSFQNAGLLPEDDIDEIIANLDRDFSKGE